MKWDYPRFVFFIPAIFCISNAMSQVIIRGKVIDGNSSDALAYANVTCLGNSAVGTVTNSEGVFILRFASGDCDSLLVSFIGYASKIFAKPANGNPLEIRLYESPRLLQEVEVSFSDTLRSILEKAYKSISENYSRSGVVVDGFYRETNYLLGKKKFLYFSESLIRYYNPGYDTREYGPVEILEGGKAEMPNRHSFSKVYFYGGPYAAQRLDFVKNSFEFIDPSKYNMYIYDLIGEFAFGEKLVYAIRFNPKENALYDGIVYLEKYSLAYVAADFKLSKWGLSTWSKKYSAAGLEYINRKYKITYKVLDDKWNVSSVVIDGLFDNDNSDTLQYTAEFIAMAHRPSTSNPIKESDALLFSEIYTLQNKKFTSQFWEKPEIISRTAQLDSTISFVFNSDKIASERGKEKMSTTTTRDRIFRIAARTSTSMSIGFMPISIVGGSYSVYHENFTAVKRIQNKVIIPTLRYDLRYHANKFWSFSFSYAASLDNHNTLDYKSLGIAWRRRVVGWRKPIQIQAGINSFLAKNAAKLGGADLINNPTINGTKLNSDKIAVSIGEFNFGVSPSFELTYKLSSKISIGTGAHVSIISSKKGYIFLKESDGFVFSRSSTRIPIGTKGFRIERDSQVSQTSNSILENFATSYFLGLTLGLK